MGSCLSSTPKEKKKDKKQHNPEDRSTVEKIEPPKQEDPRVISSTNSTTVNNDQVRPQVEAKPDVELNAASEAKTESLPAAPTDSQSGTSNNKDNDDDVEAAKLQFSLSEQERRRLSVSTIHKEQLDTAAVTAPERVIKPQQTLIRKFADPALALVDENKGVIRQVNVQTIHQLFSQEGQSTAVFGAPAGNSQMGFENKKLDVVGSSLGGEELAAKGIAYACKKGLKPEFPNQDDFFILTVDDWVMVGVFDGHGPFGHDVSHFVHNTLPFLIISDLKFEKDPLNTIRKAFRKTHHLLEAAAEQMSNPIDCSLSGTTGTIVIHRENKLYIAHVGDSRAVLGRRVIQGGRSNYLAYNLTEDHKPTTESEKARIISCGGEVRKLEGDIPHRVFMQNRMYPGLAMSRAIGDIVGSTVGIIPDPDVRIIELRDADEFLIVSTDGVWEFISSQEAVKLVSKYKRQGVRDATEDLAAEAWNRWQEEENVVDDITSVIIWFK